MSMFNQYIDYMFKNVRVISVVVYKNGRRIKTDYFGKLINETINTITIVEEDGKEINIEKRFIKRVDRNVK